MGMKRRGRDVRANHACPPFHMTKVTARFVSLDSSPLASGLSCLSLLLLRALVIFLDPS